MYVKKTKLYVKNIMLCNDNFMQKKNMFKTV